MRIRVLGAAAGGGVPQWNCNCRNCAGARGGAVRACARTQSSIAASGNDAAAWALVNASPDILAQLRANPDLHRSGALRDTAIAGVVLVDGQLDHTVGLYMLRESTRPLPIWCTDNVYADLTRGNPIVNVLAHYCSVQRSRIALDDSFVVEGVADVRWHALPVAGKSAPYSPTRENPLPGDNIALLIEDLESGRSAFYAPGLAAMDDRLWQCMQSAACVLVDGTFWTDDEMIGPGISSKRARDIGHLPQSGPDGMLQWLARLPQSTRKILIHVNNTNPILDEDSAERAELDRRGIEVAYDGMEIVL